MCSAGSSHRTRWLLEQRSPRASNRTRSQSHPEVIWRLSLFERYVLEHHPGTEYAAYLRRLRFLSATEDEQFK